MLIRFLMIVALVGLNAHAGAMATADIAASAEWQRLMHYQKGLFGGFESEVDGPEFFFAPDGKTNPEAELIASKEAMLKDIQVGKLKQHPICAFPARYRFLKKQFNLNPPTPACEKLDHFLGQFNPKSATLVFSSAYPNNPGSMFGHTFLRINAKSDQDRLSTVTNKTTESKLDMLDFGIGYAAQVSPDENAILYMVFGLFGGYQGSFSMQPYYAKLTEYTNGESRDLWEYDLDLSEEQTQVLLEHFWEIETNSYLDYFFFDENCAYHLLKALNVVRPEWDFGKFGPYVTPAESIKRVVRIPGAVKHIQFRPSLRKKLVRNYHLLDNQGKQEFDRLRAAAGESVSAVEKFLNDIKHPESLDVMSQYLLYAKSRDEGKMTSDQVAMQKKILIKRSTMNAAQAIELNWDDEQYRESQPENGHPTYRLGVSGGERNSNLFQEFNFKFALHDLLNEDVGYSSFSQIDFPGFKVRYESREYQTKKIRLESIDAVAVTSLYPWSFLDRRFSWSTRLSYETPRDIDCKTCRAVHFDMGTGITLPIVDQKWIMYSLVSVQTEAGSVFAPFFRYGPRFELSTIASPLEHVKTQLLYRGTTDVFQNQRRSFFSMTGAYLSYAVRSDLELRSGFENTWAESGYFAPLDREWKFTFHYYF